MEVLVGIYSGSCTVGSKAQPPHHPPDSSPQPRGPAGGGSGPSPQSGSSDGDGYSSSLLNVRLALETQQALSTPTSSSNEVLRIPPGLYGALQHPAWVALRHHSTAMTFRATPHHSSGGGSACELDDGTGEKLQTVFVSRAAYFRLFRSEVDVPSPTRVLDQQHVRSSEGGGCDTHHRVLLASAIDIPPAAKTATLTVEQPVGTSISHQKLMQEYVAPFFLNHNRAVISGEEFVVGSTGGDGGGELQGNLGLTVVHTNPAEGCVLIQDQTRITLQTAPSSVPRLGGRRSEQPSGHASPTPHPARKSLESTSPRPQSDSPVSRRQGANTVNSTSPVQHSPRKEGRNTGRVVAAATGMVVGQQQSQRPRRLLPDEQPTTCGHTTGARHAHTGRSSGGIGLRNGDDDGGPNRHQPPQQQQSTVPVGEGVNGLSPPSSSSSPTKQDALPQRKTSFRGGTGTSAAVFPPSLPTASSHQMGNQSVLEQQQQQPTRRRDMLTAEARSPSPTMTGLTVGIPVPPMLASPVKGIDGALFACPHSAFSEFKYDGERIQVHKADGTSLGFYSRSLVPTKPERVLDLEAHVEKALGQVHSCILDGELVAIDPWTSKLLPFTSLINKQNDSNSNNRTVALVVFDLLFLEGKSLVDEPLDRRRQLLSETLLPQPPHVFLSEKRIVTGTDEQRKAQLNSHFQDAVKQNVEGLVIKDIKSTYKSNSRQWMKVKKDYVKQFVDSADLVVLGAYYDSGSPIRHSPQGGITGKRLTAFILGCLDLSAPSGSPKRWKTVCRVGTGFDNVTIAALTQRYEVEMIPCAPQNLPTWLDMEPDNKPPDLVVTDPLASDVWELTGAELTPTKTHSAGLTFRFPRVLRQRTDKTPVEATPLAELYQLLGDVKLKETTLSSSVSGPEQPQPEVEKQRNENREEHHHSSSSAASDRERKGGPLVCPQRADFVNSCCRSSSSAPPAPASSSQTTTAPRPIIVEAIPIYPQQAEDSSANKELDTATRNKTAGDGVVEGVVVQQQGTTGLSQQQLLESSSALALPGSHVDPSPARHSQWATPIPLSRDETGNKGDSSSRVRKYNTNGSPGLPLSPLTPSSPEIDSRRRLLRLLNSPQHRQNNTNVPLTLTSSSTGENNNLWNKRWEEMEQWWGHKRKETRLFDNADHPPRDPAFRGEWEVGSPLRVEQHVDIAIQVFHQCLRTLVAAHNDLREAVLSTGACGLSSTACGATTGSLSTGVQNESSNVVSTASAACRNVLLLFLRVPPTIELDLIRDTVERGGIQVQMIWRAKATGTVYVTHWPHCRGEAMQMAGEGEFEFWVPTSTDHSPSNNSNKFISSRINPDTGAQLLRCDVVAPHHSMIDDLARVREHEIGRWSSIRDHLVNMVFEQSHRQKQSHAYGHGVFLEDRASSSVSMRMKLLDDRCEALRSFFAELRRASHEYNPPQPENSGALLPENSGALALVDSTESESDVRSRFPELEVSPLLLRSVRQHYRVMLQIIHFYRDVLPGPYVNTVANACAPQPPRLLMDYLYAERTAMNDCAATATMSPSQMLYALRQGQMDTLGEAYRRTKGARSRFAAQPIGAATTGAIACLSEEELAALEFLRRDATHALPHIPSPAEFNASSSALMLSTTRTDVAEEFSDEQMYYR